MVQQSQGRPKNQAKYGQTKEVSFTIALLKMINDIEMYSTHNEGESVITEGFIRTLKTKIYKYMTSLSKLLHIDKLYDIAYEYNDTYHRAIKMKPVNVKENTYIDSSINFHDQDPKFKISDHVRISKYKNICNIGHTPNWYEEVFLIKKFH